ncbi:MAG: DUF438 domain-containing protein [Gemmatimonadota bacterium]|nr:MAG: DUF438 domain-containing protein [Gemmatimonadota bacterium]
MSELIGNAERRKELLKHMILQLHKGEAPEQVRPQLIRVLGQVPYNDVVEVEQQLIDEGLPAEEVMRLCDMHTAALQGAIDHTGVKEPPAGHPAHTFQQENQALRWEVGAIDALYSEVSSAHAGEDVTAQMSDLQVRFNNLMDVEKHYLRKEHLLFPFLEKHGITGPPKVMWGKHDEARAKLTSAQDTLRSLPRWTASDAQSITGLVLQPASAAIVDMVDKEEQILLPMCLDTLSDSEWFEIARQSNEYGYCLYDPAETWTPDVSAGYTAEVAVDSQRIQLPSGSFTPTELQAVLNTIPFDLTFVDKDDKVRYFTQGRERIFSRSRAILGRQVEYCHPPKSVHIVKQILDDFHSGAHEHAHFWITLRGRFISIEYFALRDPEGQYLGCLEVSQDLTEKRALEGEQRLLAYADEGSTDVN